MQYITVKTMQMYERIGTGIVSIYQAIGQNHITVLYHFYILVVIVYFM